jgi:transposase
MVERIEKESAARTFSSVADELGISETSVRKIFNRYVDRRLGELGIETPRRMGLDEVYVGGKCRGLVTNLARKTIVNLMEDRKGSTVSAYLAGLPNRSDVEIVAMDFWDPYRQAVRANLPNATVVVDRFHVMAICIAALEKVRKAVRRSATRRQTAALANDRTLLLSNAEELDDEQMKSLARMFGHYPALAEAHKAKEAFRSIWECATPTEGAEQYDTWKRSLSPLVAPPFEEIVWHFDRWRNEILAFIDTGATNAYTESLNNAVRILTRIGRGYSFETLRARMLLNHSAPRPAARRYIRSSSLPPASGNEASQMNEASTPHFGIDLADVEVLIV